jgi:hypothetical protein
MAVKKEVIVTINELGEVELEYVGHKGADCKNELGPVEQALGKAKERRWEKEHVAPKKTLEQKKKIGSKAG